MFDVEKIAENLKNRKDRSAWNRGVTLYAMELVEELEQGIRDGYIYADDLDAPRILERAMLNGASDWSAYSWGGAALIYDEEIAARLCTPSELKRTHNGQRRPNASEEWLDTQARALYQAARRVKDTVSTTM